MHVNIKLLNKLWACVEYFCQDEQLPKGPVQSFLSLPKYPSNPLSAQACHCHVLQSQLMLCPVTNVVVCACVSIETHKTILALRTSAVHPWDGFLVTFLPRKVLIALSDEFASR